MITRTFVISKETYKNLKKFARKHQVTASGVTRAALADMLCKKPSLNVLNYYRLNEKPVCVSCDEHDLETVDELKDFYNKKLALTNKGIKAFTKNHIVDCAIKEFIRR